MKTLFLLELSKCIITGSTFPNGAPNPWAGAQLGDVFWFDTEEAGTAIFRRRVDLGIPEGHIILPTDTDEYGVTRLYPVNFSTSDSCRRAESYIERHHTRVRIFS